MQNRANIVKVESRDQIYLDYAETLAIFVPFKQYFFRAG